MSDGHTEAQRINSYGVDYWKARVEKHAATRVLVEANLRLQEEVNELVKRITMIDGANKRANALIGELSDEAKKMQDRLTAKESTSCPHWSTASPAAPASPAVPITADSQGKGGLHEGNIRAAIDAARSTKSRPGGSHDRD
jgi:hypothetical protein